MNQQTRNDGAQTLKDVFDASFKSWNVFQFDGGKDEFWITVAKDGTQSGLSVDQRRHLALYCVCAHEPTTSRAASRSHHSHRGESLMICMSCQSDHMSPQRIFRAAILNGTPVPETARARLEALGINTDELETRLRQQLKGGEMI